MSWARIMAPLSGGQGDVATVAAAVTLAEPFQAEMVGVYTPADVADVMPWMGEGSSRSSRRPDSILCQARGSGFERRSPFLTKAFPPQSRS